MLNVAVEGCMHGHLDQVYASLAEIEQRTGVKADLLLCAGDFQATRNTVDLAHMHVPIKYRAMGDFYRYYSGQAVAPVLTLVIGGNHEASNHLHELHWGGWLAPNIYYLGKSGVVTYAGLRIAGLSGIFKDNDYRYGHHEVPPYQHRSQQVSTYHVREFDVWKLSQLPASPRLDIMMTHDWPGDIAFHGDTRDLLRRKPFLRRDVESHRLGNPAVGELMALLRPRYWFAGHLHCKFAAAVKHPPRPEAELEAETEVPAAEVTRFLALDKCLPNRDFLQIVQFPETGPRVLAYDLDWLCILAQSHAVMSTQRQPWFRPDPASWPGITSARRDEILAKFGGSLAVPLNFVPHVPVYDGSVFLDPPSPMPLPVSNPQTRAFLAKLGLPDPWAVPCVALKGGCGGNPDAIALDDDDDDGDGVVAAPYVLKRDPNAIDLGSDSD